MVLIENEKGRSNFLGTAFKTFYNMSSDKNFLHGIYIIT
jgi:hypothetical protein